MSEGLKPFLLPPSRGETLSAEDAARAFTLIMTGGASHAQVAAFLMALRVRGETADEILGGARVMRAQAVPVKVPADALDTCGTGGDGQNTLNISTAVALVIASLGVPVAKHGNRAASSRSGTADVLQRLGVNIELKPEAIERCLAEARVCFMFAPLHHTAMRHVAPVRAELGVPTIFNLLGPLSIRAARSGSFSACSRKSGRASSRPCSSSSAANGRGWCMAQTVSTKSRSRVRATSRRWRTARSASSPSRRRTPACRARHSATFAAATRK